MLTSPLDVTELMKHCRLQLASLRTSNVEACRILRELSRELLDSGRPPTAPAIERLRQVRTDFEHLQTAIGGRAADGIPRMDLSLSQLQDDLDSQALIQAVLTRLECFAHVRHIEQPEFAHWKPCLADGKKLHEELQSAPVRQVRPLAEQFLSSQAPLNAIVTLLSEGRDLSDERWSLLLDSVSAAYGREVSTAIARGKLVLMTGAQA